MIIHLPFEVKTILNKIKEAGYEAYIVGGCVRDSILHKVPDDWDITTSAKPEEIKKIFHKTVDTGIKHGTVTVIMKGKGYEVTTYRIDGEYEDNRHPKEVVFTSNLVEDLKRRDFTINAMAYNETDGFIDVFNGLADIEKKVIRCVGNPEERFCEDALRIMRAIRFSAQLGYEIEKETKKAIQKLAPTLNKISAERIQVELVKTLVSSNPDYLKMAYELGITKIILNEFDAMMETEQNHPHHFCSVGEHTLLCLKNIENDKVLRLTMLLHDIGKPIVKMKDKNGIDHFHGHAVESEKIAKNIFRRLKFDRFTMDTVCRLVHYHDYGNGIEPNPYIVRKAMNKIGVDLFPLFLKVKKADILSQSEYKKIEKLERLSKWEEYFYEIIEKKQCVTLKDLEISGKELLDMGMKPGKEIGDCLEELLEMVLKNPEKNTKENLIAEIKDKI